MIDEAVKMEYSKSYEINVQLKTVISEGCFFLCCNF